MAKKVLNTKTSDFYDKLQSKGTASFSPTPGNDSGSYKKILVALAIVLILGVGGFFAYKLKGKSTTLSGDNKQKALDVLSKIKSHVQIPDGESPQVAVVTDAELLKSKSPSFSQAKSGDYIVVTSAWAAIYDPNADSIVAIIPLNSTGATPTSVKK